MARRTSRVIEKNETPANLSEKEVLVLMYMKDQEQHCDPPKGMKFGQFSVVCKMLEERGYIKEAKRDDIIVAFNEPTYYHITPRGYEATVWIEQERERLNAEETKRKGDIISVDELNSLFANVVKKHAYYSRRQWQSTFWNRAMEYLLRLFDSEQPAMHIYSIANELSALKTNGFMWSGCGEVFDGNRIAFQMYLVIYYKYRDHPIYNTMLKALLPVTGVLSHSNRIEGLHNALDQAIKTRELIMKNAQQEKTEGTDQLWQQLKERNEEIGRLKEEKREEEYWNEKADQVRVELNNMDELTYLRGHTKVLEKDLEWKDKEIKKLQIALQYHETKDKGMTASEAAIFITAICHSLRQIPNNGRESLHPILQKNWGFTEQTARQALRSKITQEKADKLATKFEQLTPVIASIIKELPTQLDSENKERLRRLNDKNVKKT